jgi:uncharacterized protein
VLIIAPPSETKRPAPEDGPPVNLAALSFPELTPIRERIIHALIATSAGHDAFQRLRLKPSMAADVARNTRLLELPALQASDLYTGPLHEGLDVAGLSPAGVDRAWTSLLIVSSLWGAVRPDDRIPPYRLIVWSNLVGLGRLEPLWRTVLPDVLARAAGDGIAVDLRSGPYMAVGMPAGMAERTIALRVIYAAPNGGRIGDVIAKRVRGQAAHVLLESATSLDEPDEVADALSDRWPVDLEPPERPGRTWTLRLSVVDA